MWRHRELKLLAQGHTARIKPRGQRGWKGKVGVGGILHAWQARLGLGNAAGLGGEDVGWVPPVSTGGPEGDSPI